MIVLYICSSNSNLSVALYSRDINNTVYAIQPVPELAEQLRAQNLPNLHVFDSEAVKRKSIARPYTSAYEGGSLSNNAEQHIYAAKTIERSESAEKENIDLDTFIQDNYISEIDLLKIDLDDFYFQILESTGNKISYIKKISIKLKANSDSDGVLEKDKLIEYLYIRGYRLTYCNSQPGELEETLEFSQVNRYPLTDPKSDCFTVDIPYVGSIDMPKNDYVGQLLEEGIFEVAEQAFLWLYLRPGDVFLDCGAHAGLFSCIASRLLENTGKIVGFEPNPSCNEFYRKNLSKLGANHFVALNIGLSDQDGSAEMLLGKAGMSAFNTLATGASSHPQISQHKIDVKLRPLDEIVTELGIAEVALAKLDVEGWEEYVLKGAAQSIKAGKFPLWMIEFTENNAIAANSNTKQLRSLIEAFGYTLCNFDAVNLCLVPEPHRESYSYKNLFAVSDIRKTNLRLKAAKNEHLRVAKDLLCRYDMAIRARMQNFNVSQEDLYLKEAQIQMLANVAKEREAALLEVSEAAREREVALLEKEEQIQLLSSEINRLRTQFGSHPVSKSDSDNSPVTNRSIFKNLFALIKN